MNFNQALMIFSLSSANGCSIADISKRAKQLLKMAHPDNGGSSEEVIKVLKARDILVNHFNNECGAGVRIWSLSEYIKAVEGKWSLGGAIVKLNGNYRINYSHGFYDEETLDIYVKIKKGSKYQYDFVVYLDRSRGVPESVVVTVEDKVINISNPIGLVMIPIKICEFKIDISMRFNVV